MPDLSLVVFIALVIVTAATGIFFQPGEWYAALRKPVWTPPDWMFGPVWSVLYLMIAVAGWQVWKAQGLSPLLYLWFAQLIFNGVWSWLFFGMRRMDLALVDVVFMWLSIALFIGAAWGTVTLAAALFVPYLAWVTVATALNATVWRMNPGAA